MSANFNMSIHGVNSLRARFDESANTRWVELTFVGVGGNETLTIFCKNRTYCLKIVEAINNATYEMAQIGETVSCSES